jgi:uncharacterized membrane-anchored protein YitT (DUF2179 family)
MGISKKSIRNIRDYSAIVIGSALMGLGIGVFLVDAHVVPGGVSGLSMAIHYATDGKAPVGTMMWLMNLPLFVWGVRELGKTFGLRTFVGFTLSSWFVDFFRGDLPIVRGWPLHKTAAIQNLMEQDFLFLVLWGAVLLGLGLGIIFKFKGTTGGSDIVAAVAHKRWRARPGQVIMLVDFFVIALAGVVLAFQPAGTLARPAMVLTLYAFFLLFISAYLIDVIIDGFNYARAAIIISDKNQAIGKRIMNEMDRGATAIKGRGLYTGADREVLLTVVTRKEIGVLQELVHEEDPKSFIITHDVHEVLGEGFKRRR